MPGGQLQLNSLTGNDSFLNINPQMSYFKTVYYKYHNYAKITHYLDFKTEGTNNFLEENKFTISIPKNGDLIKEFYIKVSLPELTLPEYNSGCGGDETHITGIKWVDNIQYNIIKSITFSIGGRDIQTFDSVFLYTYYTLLLNNEEKYRLNNLNNTNFNLDNTEDLTKWNIGKGSCSGCFELHGEHPITLNSNELLIPIPVWFSNEPYPVMTLEYNTLDVVLETRSLSELVLYTTGSDPKWIISTEADAAEEIFNMNFIINPSILLNYIYLHKNELEQYYVNTYKFLIETYQSVYECDILNSRGFNKDDDILTYEYESIGPTKDIFILPRRGDYKKRGERFNFTNASYMNLETDITTPARNIIEHMSIKFNAIMRLEEKHWSYFTDLELFKSYISSYKNNNIYIYNFALEPCITQPSGHCNVTHINKIIFKIKINKPNTIKDQLSPTTMDLMIYNRYYNILETENGFTKLLYFK